MSAETLRRAAALMRERAEAATTHPFGRSWTASPHGDVHTGYSEWICDSADGGTAEHIASWHPAVALAVADWLDAEARQIDAYLAKQADPTWRFAGLWTRAAEERHAHALTVAQTYLGADA